MFKLIAEQERGDVRDIILLRGLGVTLMDLNQVPERNPIV